jgi:hypothetical protein
MSKIFGSLAENPQVLLPILLYRDRCYNCDSHHGELGSCLSCGLTYCDSCLELHPISIDDPFYGEPKDCCSDCRTNGHCLKFYLPYLISFDSNFPNQTIFGPTKRTHFAATFPKALQSLGMKLNQKLHDTSRVDVLVVEEKLLPRLLSVFHCINTYPHLKIDLIIESWLLAFVPTLKFLLKGNSNLEFAKLSQILYETVLPFLSSPNTKLALIAAESIVVLLSSPKVCFVMNWNMTLIIRYHTCAMTIAVVLSSFSVFGAFCPVQCDS